MRFVLPWTKGLRPRWMLRLGLFLYDHIGGRRALPATRSIDLRRHVAGAALRPGFGPAYAYSDGWVDDARLVVLNARDAADRGATVRTRTEVTGLAREGELWAIRTAAETFRARIVINATGPSVLDLLDRAGQRDRTGCDRPPTLAAIARVELEIAAGQDQVVLPEQLAKSCDEAGLIGASKVAGRHPRDPIRARSASDGSAASSGPELWV